MVNLDIMTFFTFLSACDFSGNYAMKFYGHMTVIPAFIVVLFLAHATVRFLKWCFKYCDVNVKFSVQSASMNRTRMLAGVVFVMYPGLSVKCFRVFNCFEVNGKTFLMADPAVRCDDAAYGVLSSAALFSVFLYVLGIPLFGAFTLWRWKSWLIAEVGVSASGASACGVSE